MSQLEMSEAAGLSRSTVGRVEAGEIRPSLATFVKLISVAGLALVLVDESGRVVRPMQHSDDLLDGAERRYPSHLDTVILPGPDHWWGDVYGLARPPETFYRDRESRDVLRRRSQWEVRVKKYRSDPEPPELDQYWARKRRAASRAQ